MEEKNRMESMGQNVLKYVETKMNLMLLETSDKASTLISSIASILLMAVCMLFVLIFLSIGAALWIGHAFDNASMGFLIIGLFYLVISIILYAVRETLIKIPVVNKILSAFHANSED
jgi:hypothetical protein